VAEKCLGLEADEAVGKSSEMDAHLHASLELDVDKWMISI
jgi:hypothetical protein